MPKKDTRNYIEDNMKKKRQDTLIKLLSEEKFSKQELIAEALQKKGFDASQSTIHRDIKELNVGTDDEGFYIVAPHLMQKRREEVLSDTLKTASTSCFSPTFTMMLKVSQGYEKLTCLNLQDAFPNLVIGTIAGDGVVLVMTNSEENMHELSMRLSKLLPINE